MRTYFLTTNRIGFSCWTEADLEIAIALWGDPSVTKFICATGVFSEQQIKDRLETEIKNNEMYQVQYWPIFERSSDTHIGCCGLRPYDVENKMYELGFHIKSQHWGKGYAHEAATAAIQYAFDKIQANNLFAGHNPQNTASQKVLTKLHFTYSHDEYYAPTGLNHPSYRYFV